MRTDGMMPDCLTSFRVESEKVRQLAVLISAVSRRWYCSIVRYWGRAISRLPSICLITYRLFSASNSTTRRMFSRRGENVAVLPKPKVFLSLKLNVFLRVSAGVFVCATCACNVWLPKTRRHRMTRQVNTLLKRLKKLQLQAFQRGFNQLFNRHFFIGFSYNGFERFFSSVARKA